MKSFRDQFDGISGSSCSHLDGYGERVHYEACEKHHGDAAYDIAKRYLKSNEVNARISFALARAQAVIALSRASGEPYVINDIAKDIVAAILEEK